MPIPLPSLDDRRWADLVEQGRALIPLASPDWTDHNASDPGITLMELLAWIAEMNVYRINRITARQKRLLLQLLQIRPDPPRPSLMAAELRITAGPEPVALPAAIEFAGTTLDGDAVLLRTTRSVEIVAAELRVIQRMDERGFHNATAAWGRQEPVPLFGADPKVGSEVYFGLDRPLPAGAWAQIYFRCAGERTGVEERRRLLNETPATSIPPHHSARTRWEYLSGAAGAPRWRRLESDDDTRSFTLSGPVRLRPDGAMTAHTLGSAAKPLYYVRCRLTDGAFDEAPRADRIQLNAVEVVQAVPVWQTWTIAAGAEVSGTPTPGQSAGLIPEWTRGEISKLAVDPAATTDPRFLVLAYVPPTATSPGQLSVQAALAGFGTGEPDQTLKLPRPTLVEHTVRLFGLEGAEWREWTRVDDLAASQRWSPDFLLDPTTGEVTFGDGQRGRTPPDGCLLVALYDSTQAETAGARVAGLADAPLNRVLLNDPGLVMRLAAGEQFLLEAGAPAETLTHAVGRGFASREARVRAITAEDFEAIALETPGTRIARAIARPNLYPGLDRAIALGVVSVIVLPSLPEGVPVPSAGLIAQVAARLERRRTIGTRVVVTGPRYLEVAVRARVRGFGGVDRAVVSQQVAQALDAFFHPLTGGPARTGWPLGRDVFRAEVMQVIDETPGVDHVLSLALMVEGCAPNCGNVCLGPTWLVAAGPHEIEVLSA